MSKLAKEIWQRHDDVWWHFDYKNEDGVLPESEKKLALHSAIVTLEAMNETAHEYTEEYSELISVRINKALDYLKGSKYYSDDNKDADY